MQPVPSTCIMCSSLQNSCTIRQCAQTLWLNILSITSVANPPMSPPSFIISSNPGILLTAGNILATKAIIASLNNAVSLSLPYLPCLLPRPAVVELMLLALLCHPPRKPNPLPARRVSRSAILLGVSRV